MALQEKQPQQSNPVPTAAGGLLPVQPTSVNQTNPAVSPPIQPNPAPQASPSLAEPTKLPKAKKTKTKGVSTQGALLISEIRDGLVIMKDGSLRAVVMCQSINFDLMSPAEREAVEFTYQGFLNALYFPIQIFIRSQRVDLNSYIDKLEAIHTGQENILLSLLMEDYIAYVRYLVEAANVMDKQFYVVVPYYPPLTLQKGGISTGIHRFTSFLRPKTGPIVINQADYARFKAELTQRVQAVLSGLNQMGTQAVPLNTQELIELYYTVYNPQTALSQRLTDVDDLEAQMVEKGQGQAPPVLHGDSQL